MTRWWSGAAAVPFPIPAGTPLAGYAARTGPATGTIDELSVGASVLTDGEHRLALVAADVIAVDAALVDEVARATELDRAELLLCASHSHSGPAGIVPRLHPAAPDATDAMLRGRFVATCAQAITVARAGLAPVQVVVGTAPTTGVAANRNDPSGPVDPMLSVLAARRLDGSLQSVVVHFACHPTVLPATNRSVSADLPGALRRALAAKLRETGPPPVVMYVNGAAGDVSTRYTRHGQDPAEMQRFGVLLADAAATALARARPVTGPLRSTRLTVPLSRRILESSIGDSGRSTPPDPERGDADQRRAETQAQGAALLARLVEVGPGAIPISLDLGVWTLDGVSLLAVPGELFAALGARIAAASLPPTLVLGYANGYAGYLPDEAAYRAETYEALASPYAPGAGEQVADAAVTILGGLAREADRL